MKSRERVHAGWAECGWQEVLYDLNLFRGDDRCLRLCNLPGEPRRLFGGGDFGDLVKQVVDHQFDDAPVVSKGADPKPVRLADQAFLEVVSVAAQGLAYAGINIDRLLRRLAHFGDVPSVLRESNQKAGLLGLAALAGI